MVGATTIRLVTRPHAQRRSHGALVHIDKFEAWLDGELICVSRQPRLDGARELLKRGHSPSTMMTTRELGRDYDSWRPAPLGELAKWTIVDRSRDGLLRRTWEPFVKGDSAPPVDSRTRETGLRGAMVLEQEDDAVSPDRTGATAHPNAA